VGIFVSAVQEGSIAAMNGLQIGDRLHVVNGKSLNGATREDAVELLLALNDEVCIHVEHQNLKEACHSDEFARVRYVRLSIFLITLCIIYCLNVIRDEQLGDSFYVRAHLTHAPCQKRANRGELSFQCGGGQP